MLNKSDFRNNIMYYRFLKSKEDLLQSTLNIDLKKIVPFNPTKGKSEITKYQNTINFDISYDKQFSVKICSNFKNNYELGNIDHPLIGMYSDASLFVSEDCLTISNWFESWLNNNTLLKHNIFKSINIKVFPGKYEKKQVMLSIYFSDYKINPEWKMGEQLFLNYLTNILVKNDMNLASLYYKFMDDTEFKIVYYNSDIYQEMDGLRIKITPDIEVDKSDILLYQTLKRVFSQHKIGNIPIVNLNSQFNNYNTPPTYISKILHNLCELLINVDENQTNSNTKISLNNNLNEINNICWVNYENSMEEVLDNIEKINVIINDSTEALNQESIQKINKYKDKIELIILLSFDTQDVRHHKLKSNIELLRENFELENIYLLDSLPFSKFVKTMSIFTI